MITLYKKIVKLVKILGLILTNLLFGIILQFLCDISHKEPYQYIIICENNLKSIMLKNKGIEILISRLYFNSKVITDINQNEILDYTKRPHMPFNNTLTTSFIFLVDFVFIIKNQFIPKFTIKEIRLEK